MMTQLHSPKPFIQFGLNASCERDTSKSKCAYNISFNMGRLNGEMKFILYKLIVNLLFRIQNNYFI